MGEVGAIVDPGAALGSRASCAEAHRLFTDKPEASAIALLDGARAVGLLERGCFYSAGFGPDGAAFAAGPALRWAQPLPLTVAAAQSCVELAAQFERSDTSPLQSFIAVSAAGFAGVGSAGAVYRAAALARRREAARLGKLAALLERARSEALAANGAKSRFIAQMSYELRTHLNAINGYAELIADDHGADNTALREDAGAIVFSARQLQDLVTQVLDFARLESGAVEFDPEPIEIAPWLDDALEVIRPLAEQGGNALSVEVDEALGEAFADAERLRQCLLNVAGNACKFTAGGQIGVVARAAGESGARWLELVVRDTGIGMSAEQLAKLFKPFEQTDPRIAVQYGGNGLGLSITKQLVERMGGRIAAQSAPGQGSTFTIAVPIDSGEDWRVAAAD